MDEVNPMRLEFNKAQLLELMKDFYTLSGVRIALFDDESNELLSFPEEPCRFCGLMKQNPDTRCLCDNSDLLSFRRTDTEKKQLIYHCHAGLIESTIRLEENHITIGYLMFGQISDLNTPDELRSLLEQKLREYGLEFIGDPSDGIPLKSSEQIHAAAKIMEACTNYALLSQAIGLRRQRFSGKLKQYLISHLSEQLQSQDVANALGISRSKLYLQCQQYLGMGIGSYVRKLRMEQAQALLRSTTLSVNDVASQVGFDDYNYFCRVFRQQVGISPQKYQSQFRSL